MRQRAKRSYKQTKANFELLNLIADEIDNDDAQQFIGVIAATLKPECYNVFK